MVNFLPIVSEFKSLTKEVCKLPSFFSTSLFRKIDTNCTGVVTRYALFMYLYACINLFNFGLMKMVSLPLVRLIYLTCAYTPTHTG